MTSEFPGPVALTLNELADFLDHPKVTGEQMRRIFANLPRLNPVTTRKTGGRPADAYDADTVIEWHHANARWL